MLADGGGAMRWKWKAAAVATLCGVSGCSSRVDEAPPLEGIQSPLGGNVIEDTTSRTGVISAVGRVATVSGICSGTLIAPNVVLTAGHCMNGGWPTGFFLPQDGPNGRTYQVVNAARAGHGTSGRDCTYGGRAEDLGLLWLGTPVAPDVAEPQQIFSGRISKEIHRLVFHALAGFGTGSWDLDGCSPPNDPNASGLRSWNGLQATVHYDSDSDDGFWERHCHHFRAEFSFHTNPRYLRGDSGGPLLARFDDGTWRIMGVASGAECTDEQAVYSTVERNYRWIVDQLGGDFDEDGVPDNADNCAPWRCTALGMPAEACANPDQEDDDADGIGEVCDNCPALRCARNLPGFDCVNPDQADGDQDGDGDQCDLCPDKGALTYDEDGDGVGEACDNCPESYVQFSACTVDSDCKKQGRCIGGSSPHCSQLPDEDGDGIGDSCDLCPTIASYDTNNANSWAEEREVVAPIADVCEKVPQVRLTQTPNATFAVPSPTALFGVEPVVGGRVPAQSGRARMGFCSCYDVSTGFELNEDQCLAQSKPCSAWNLPTETGTWKPISLDAGGDIHQETAPPFQGLTSSLTYRAVGEARPRDMSWNWLADVNSGRIDGIDCPGDTCRAYGAFMMSAVVAPNLSGRDASYALRDTHKIVRAPFFRETPFGDTPDWKDPCFPSGCTWYRPGVELIRPQEWLTQPGILVVGPDGAPSILTDNGPFLATFESSPDLLQALAEPGQRWISAVESPRQTAALKAALPGLEAVRVPRDLGADIQGLSLYRGGGEVGIGSFGGLIDDGGPAGPAISVQSSLASLAPTPGPRVGPEYVLSATLGQLFVIGGEVGADPISAGDIWRFDLARGGWLQLDTPFFAPSRILSSTFEAGSQQLIVLSIDDSDTVLGRKRAQLHTIDVRTGAAKLVLFWPYLGIFEKYAVAVLEDGDVVIAASKGKRTKLWKFEERRGHYWPAGRLRLRGSMLDQPAAVDNGLQFALMGRGGTVEVKSVISTDFKSGPHCSGL